jgi:hypothetical protein
VWTQYPEDQVAACVRAYYYQDKYFTGLVSVARARPHEVYPNHMQMMKPVVSLYPMVQLNFYQQNDFFTILSDAIDLT